MKSKVLLGAIAVIGMLPSIALAEMSLGDKYQNLDIIYANDWREDNLDMPWSDVVIVEDDFDGQYLAVFDREKRSSLSVEVGIISEWSKKQLKVNFYHKIKQFIGKSPLKIGYAERIALKVGDSVFKLESKDGIYQVTPEMAKAFANAPDKIVKMRVYPSENDGIGDVGALQEVTIELDMETIDAWKSIYGNQEIAAQ